MNKEKIIQLINKIEKIVSELKLEILDRKEAHKKKFPGPSKLSLEKDFGTTDNKGLLDKVKKSRISLENYPLIKDSAPVFIKSLYVLDIVKNELKIEELSASQISTIMPYFNKLRKASRHAVTKALDRHKELVSIRKESLQKIFYSIKNEGIKYYRNYKEIKKKKYIKPKR